jgi:sugar lactone lactonase YvrE
MRILAMLGLSLGLIHGEPDIRAQGCEMESSLAPVSSGRQSAVEFVNQTVAPANVYLGNEARQRLFLRTLWPGERFSQRAIEGQPFVVTDTSGRCLEVHRASTAESRVEISASQPAAAASGPIIQTFAGTDWTFQADGQSALNAPIGSTTDLTFDPAGNLYITDNLNYQVYRVDTNGTLRVIGGNGFDSARVNGVDARRAPLNRPISVAIGPDGSVYVAQSYTIARITPDGILSRFAGLNTNVFSGDGGPALNAGVQSPLGMVFDSAGNLFYSDRLSNRVRRIDTNGIITTFAGNGQQASAGDNGQATSASLFSPAGLRLDAAGNLYIADVGAGRIRRVDTSGIITTFAGGAASLQDGVPATQTLLSGPVALDFDAAGNLYILEQNRGRVRKVTPGGIITTVAGAGAAGFSGDGGPAINAQFNAPIALKVDASGNVYVGDTNNRRVRRFTPGGNIATVVGNGLYRFSPDGAPATLSFLKDPTRVAVAPNGRLHITDAGDARIRRVEANGTLTTVAGTGQSVFTPGKGPFPAASTSITAADGLTFDPQGNLYFVESGLIRRVTPDGMMTTYAGGGSQNPGNEGPATSAQLFGPAALATDRSGTLYFSEASIGRIRKVTADGIIHAVAGMGSQGFADGPAAQAQFNNPRGLTLDAAGNLYIGDLSNNRVRKLDTNGNVTTYAGTGQTSTLGDGGPAALANFSAPTDLAFDAAGNLLIMDQFHFRVRSVSPSGTISTLAGNGAIAFTGDGGPAQAASLNNPFGVAVDNAGNIYVADRSNFRVRIIPKALPTLTAAPASLSFAVRSGDAPPKPQQVSLASSVVGLPYTITINGSFLAVNASSAVTPATLDVTVNPASLAPGTYPATITFTPGVSGVPPVSVSVNVVVQSPIPSLLAVDTAGLSFSLVRGGSTASKRVLVLDSGNGSVDFTVSAKTASGGNWLSASPSAGTATNSAPVSLLVTADPKGLAAGTYSGNVIIADADGETTILVPVTMTLSGSGQIIRLSQGGLTFVGVVGGGVSPAQSVVVLNGGQGPFQFNAVARPTSGSWLAVTPSSGPAIRARPFQQLRSAWTQRV